MDHVIKEARTKKITEALGQSEAFLTTQERISRVAQVNRPVLLIGERGTGKELAAQRIHFLSKRWQLPFVTLNCSTLTPTLVETELFGHEAGAFTGAVACRKGRFELANEGSFFLDEIGTMPLEVQEKILRVIEYGVFERVGGMSSVHVDVRIIAATNTDLPALVRKGRFKDDLLDRLSFEVIHLPPLRERIDDIMLLAGHFAAKMAVEMGIGFRPTFSDAAMRQLIQYPWPGNVRELKNVVERAVYRASQDVIDQIEVDPFSEITFLGMNPSLETEEAKDVPVRDPFPTHDLLSMPFGKAVETLEARLIGQALQKAKFNQRKAAKALGLTYHQLRGLLKKHKGLLKSEKD